MCVTFGLGTESRPVSMFVCPSSRLSQSFHVGIHDFAHEFRLTIEGPFTSAETTEVEARWRTASSIIGGKPFRVDLDGVTEADQAARALLKRMHSHGAQFVANKMPARRIADETVGQISTERAAEHKAPARLYQALAAFLACLAIRLRIRPA